MEWFNEPPQWSGEANGKVVKIKAGAKTDFWCITHYGFTRDNGHFYYREVAGDFVAQVKISGKYLDLYDQAGLMVRQDENYWVKSGIEFVEGVQQVSAVVTREYSDWSVVPLPSNPPSLWLRLKREKDALEIEYSLDGAKYNLLRLAYLPPSPQIKAGLMCAAPDGEGFEVTFEDFLIEPIP